ncbi:hypothetical protein BH20ACT5_BH20ACT5_03150 [soil metagenome]
MTSRRHHVVLVRQWDQQMSGSGCCGRLGGVGNDLSDAADFAPQRADMEEMGVIYRRLRAELPDDVELTVVDPRNTVWLVPRLLRDGHARGLRGRTLWRQVSRGTSSTAVVVDGLAVAWGALPGPDEVLARVRAQLQPPGGRAVTA